MNSRLLPRRRFYRPGILCVVLVMAVAWSSVQANDTANDRATLVEQVQRLRLVASSIGYHALLSSYGSRHEIEALVQSRSAFEAALKDLSRNLDKDAADPAITRALPLLHAVDARWVRSVRTNIDHVLQAQHALIELPARIRTILDSVDRLAAVSDEVVEIGAGEGVRADLLYLAERQGMLSQRIAKSIVLFGQAVEPVDTRSQSGGGVQAVALSQFGKDVKLFGETLVRLRARMPSAAKAKLEESAAIFDGVSSSANAILRDAGPLFVAKRSARLVFEQFGPLVDDIERLEKAIRELGKTTPGKTRRKQTVRGISRNLILL